MLQQNVLISRTGDALLCDLGLSVILSDMTLSGVPSSVEHGLRSEIKLSFFLLGVL